MVQVTVRQARAKLSRILESAQAGQIIEITRHGRPVARLVPASGSGHGAAAPLPDLSAFRSQLKVRGKAMSRVVAQSRREARF